MNTPTHRTGTVRSGDVSLFYRRFGKPGATPILITHGANYYDSHDWIDVAQALSADREVVAYDTRGFGESSWSASKNYSQDAQIGDMVALVDHFGWNKVIAMGHSMGGGRVILFGSRFPERAAGVVLVDHCPGRSASNAKARVRSIDNPPLVFPTIEAAVAEMSRNPDAPEGSPARARLDMILKPTDGGFIFPRDPDYANPVPVGIEDWTPEIVATDMWAELAAIGCPIVIFRGTLSDRYSPEALARMKSEYPHIGVIDVEAGHDVAGAVPEQLIDGVKRFLAERIDAEAAAVP